MTSVYWERYELTKYKREWTPLRIKAAERAVQREADAMAFFPELRRVHTVDQRIQQMDDRTDRITKRMRAARAADWRKARAWLRSLSPSERAVLLAKWNTRFTPGTPSYLFSVARMMGFQTPNPFEEAAA